MPSVEELFNDPNFLSLLAGVGIALDPEGVGGRLGKQAQSLIQGQAAQKVTEGQENVRAGQNVLTSASQMQPGPAKDEAVSYGLSLMSMTPPGQKGITKIAKQKAGGYTMDFDIVDGPLDTRSGVAQTQGSSAPSGGGGQVPGYGRREGPQTPEQRLENLLPFFLAPRQ